jgi:hypothetical protein
VAKVRTLCALLHAVSTYRFQHRRYYGKIYTEIYYGTVKANLFLFVIKIYDVVATHVHNLGYRWRRMVSLKTSSLYPQGKELPRPIPYSARWTPETVWTLRRTEKSLLLSRIESLYLGSPVRSLVTIPTELFPLLIRLCIC